MSFNLHVILVHFVCALLHTKLYKQRIYCKLRFRTRACSYSFISFKLFPAPKHLGSHCPYPPAEVRLKDSASCRAQLQVLLK